MGSDPSKLWSEVNSIGGQCQETGLHYAAREGRLLICEVLLQQDASINMRDKHGRQPLHQAALGGHTDVCELLVSQGADVTARDHQGNTPLILAAYNHCSPATCKLLITADNIDVAGSGSNRALHVAAAQNDPLTVETLLECGANVNAVNRNGQTALHTAAGLEQDSSYLCKTLLSYNANVAVEDEDGNRPLHLASRRGHIETAGTLVAHGADTNACNNDGRTSLHEAIIYGMQYGSWRMCEVLFSHSADVNVADRKGDTPCHLLAAQATYSGVDCIRLLSEHGADWSMRNKRGLSALEVAQLEENRHTVPHIPYVDTSRGRSLSIPARNEQQVRDTTPAVVARRRSLPAVQRARERRSETEQLVDELLVQTNALHTDRNRLLQRVARLEAQIAMMTRRVEETKHEQA